MKTILSIAMLIALVVPSPGARCRAETVEEGAALAIVFDTSGSMKDPVRDVGGANVPKYLIADRALGRIADQIEAFRTNAAAGASRKIWTTLYVFGDSIGREAIPFGPFSAKALKDWAARFSNPTGNTPLGNTLRQAGQRVLNSPLSRKHVLIITDGLNTSGPDPAAVLPGLKRQAELKQTPLSVHFVAFDTDARQFSSVKRLGATVVGAADEKQLNTQLEFILKRQILLEEEEPKK